MSGRFYPVTVNIEGRTYAGEWTPKQGGMICVGGFYGSKTEALGRAKPEDAAAKILRELVTTWQAKKARELTAWEAKRKRLNPGPPRC